MAAHLSVGPKFNGHQNLTHHWFLLSFLPVSVDDLRSHARYQLCGKVLSTYVKLHYSSEKKLIYTN